MLNIENLKAKIDNKEILKGLNLNINPGEVHAIMGPNGSGKSTLSNILSGKKGYEVNGSVSNSSKFSPSNDTVPLTSYPFFPDKILDNVLLPDPLGPIIAWTSPGLIFKFSPFNISLLSIFAFKFSMFNI